MADKLFSLNGFKFGLDKRKAEIESVPGTLFVLRDAFINQGAEIEKRKAFIRAFNVSMLDGNGDAGTFGYETTSVGHTVFGSATAFGSGYVSGLAAATSALTGVGTGATLDITAAAGIITVATVAAGGANYVVGDFLTLTGLSGSGVVFTVATLTGSAVATVTISNYPVLASAMPAGVTYQKLRHPAIIELQAYDRTKHRMTAVVHSHNYGGFAWVVATFADTETFVYYAGSLINDFTAGLILAHLAGNTDANRNLIAAHLINRVNDTEGYTGSNPTGAGNLDITGEFGNDFTVTVDEDSALGVITPSNQQAEIAPVSGSSAMGSFRVIAGTAGVKASGTLTSTGTAPANNDTVTIGSVTYTFKTALSAGPTVPYEVLIGASADAALDNLKAAINDTGVEGTNYSVGTVAHPTVEATTNTATTQLVVARIGGTAGNAIATTEVSAQLSWGAATLLNGTDPNYISLIEVGPIGGPFTSLTNSNVVWITSDYETAQAVIDEINSIASGFTAIRDADEVKILSDETTGDAYNEWLVRVTAVGNVCIGNLYFLFSAANTSFSVTSILMDGVELLSGGPHTISTTMEALVAAVSADINDATGTHGYVSCPLGKFLYVSKKVTASTDPNIDVFVTVTNGGYTAYEEPKGELKATLSPTTQTQSDNDQDDHGVTFTSNAVTCEVVGGVQPYAYRWKLVSHIITTDPPVVGTTESVPERTILGEFTSVAKFTRSYPRGTGRSLPEPSIVISTDTYVCEVTDFIGSVSVSNPFVMVTRLQY